VVSSRLLVEDDAAIGRSLCDPLSSHGDSTQPLAMATDPGAHRVSREVGDRFEPS